MLEKESLVLHWDGKLLPDITYGKSKVDRLPVIVSFEGITQLLGVPKLERGTGDQQANTIFNIINDWGITNKVQALCCDTTASNTGRLNGACILLEQLIGRNLLYLPCRRHIFELILRSVFEVKLKINTIGPDVPIFKKFQQAWPGIDLTIFEVGINDAYVKSMIEMNRFEIINFCLHSLQKKQCRDDYKELLELTIIFLGGKPSNGISFHYPGAYHHARWMSKAIYSLKIYMFRKQFKLSVREENAFRDICIFVVKLYVEVWFKCPVAIESPFNDLIFLKKLIEYPDTIISKAAVHKFCGHLWYLAPENIALSFFDFRVPTEIKIKMVEAIKSSQGIIQ